MHAVCICVRVCLLVTTDCVGLERPEVGLKTNLVDVVKIQNNATKKKKTKSTTHVRGTYLYSRCIVDSWHGPWREERTTAEKRAFVCSTPYTQPLVIRDRPSCQFRLFFIFFTRTRAQRVLL